MSCTEFVASKEQAVKVGEGVNISQPKSKYRRLWTHFQNMFPSLASGVKHWRAGKYNTIELDTTAGVTLFFTYDDVEHWKLETEGSPRTKHIS